MKDLVIAILSAFFLSLFYARGFLSGLISYQLNNNAYKKRKKNQTFKEWLLYSRFKLEIPKAFLILYYIILIIHPLCSFFCAIFHLLKLHDIGTMLIDILIFFDCGWTLLIHLLFWQSKPGYAYERWIDKIRGQKKKRK